MPYFLTTDATHTALLPEAIRSHSDLVNLAAGAEADALAEFTRQSPDPRGVAVVLDAGTVAERYVWLAGYTADPTAALASFATAFRREVANTIRWRAAKHAKKPGVTSESAGEPATSKSYDLSLERGLPPDFGMALRPFMLRSVPDVL